ncbi:GNAT family N-acetyltransferase [Bdellovibrio sp. HCB290]|uniref:GNAT family N-acetyltransferase n=1 Tax=Bdellovibrio sp. HCB290 TaxID=3394356 RepID=UPI0039B65D68
MKPMIRRALHEDAANIINAHRRSIREVCSNDYSSEQITAWSGLNFQEDRWCHTMDQDMVWVISDQNRNIFGFGHLQFQGDSEAEVAGLYFVPEVVGQNFGKEIVKLMIEECKKKNIRTIHLSATKTAKTFYENVGFKQIAPQSSVTIGGKAIECFKMQTALI